MQDHTLVAWIEDRFDYIFRRNLRWRPLYNQTLRSSLSTLILRTEAHDFACAYYTTHTVLRRFSLKYILFLVSYTCTDGSFNNVTVFLIPKYFAHVFPCASPLSFCWFQLRRALSEDLASNDVALTGAIDTKPTSTLTLASSMQDLAYLSGVM